jgi:hypothetical protein
MGVKNYLIEGGSGVGKTTVAEELQRRGYHVIHGDRGLAYYGEPQTGEPREAPRWLSETDRVRWGYEHWIWPVDTVKSIVADHGHKMTFCCGHSANAQHFTALFDEVFILAVDLDTLNRRLARRPEDEFGGRPIERELVVRLHQTNADLPKAATRIDATAPVARVADAILARCSGTQPGKG